MKNKTNLGSKKVQASPPPQDKVADYEIQRINNMEKNAMKFKELGLEKLAVQLFDKAKRYQNKGKEKLKVANKNVDNDPDYVPNQDDEQDSEPMLPKMPCLDIGNINVLTSSTSELVPQKIMAQEISSAKKKKKPLCPSMEMNDFIIMQQQQEASEATQLEADIQSLECRLRPKRKKCVVLQSDSQEVIPSQQEGHMKKNCRGPTNLFHVHSRKFEDRVMVYCNEMGQPIGPEKEKTELSQFLGTIARDYSWAPLTYTNWKMVPDQDKIWQYVNTKYILPPTAKGWVLKTLDDIWRGFKCAIKRNHYYPYDNNNDRWANRPKRVPEAHFKTLLQYWGTKVAKKTSLQNYENRMQSDNMHTCGPKSFAGIYEQMLEEDGEVPSKIKKFERTRQRKEGRTYMTSYDDTHNKIQKMRELEALQAQETTGTDEYDPFDRVMPETRNGIVRLQGRAISCKKLEKGKGSEPSIMLPPSVMESIKSVVQKEVSVEKEELAKAKEAHAAEVAKFEAEKESMRQDVVAMVLSQLCQSNSMVAPELITNAIMLATNGDREHP